MIYMDVVIAIYYRAVSVTKKCVFWCFAAGNMSTAGIYCGRGLTAHPRLHIAADVDI